MTAEIDPGIRKSSWELTKENCSKWWNNKRQQGEVIPWAHPDELAEHMVFAIRDYFRDKTLPINQDPNVEVFQRAITEGRYSEVINIGEFRFRNNNLGANSSLLEKLFNELV